MLPGGQEVDKPAGWRRLAAALYYCGASMAVQTVNKALFTVFGFNFPLLVALLQMLVIAPVCYVVARPRLSWDTARSVLPLALVNVTNVVCGLIGTGGLNIPMFIALRRFTLVCTIVLERFMLNKVHDKATVGAVLVMIGGALIAAATDLTFTLYGYAAVLGNDLLTAWYLILVKQTPALHSLSTTGLLFYNALLSLPLLLASLLASAEPRGILGFQGLLSPGLQVTLALSCVLGLSINHSTFVCTRLNDPLTTSVAGSCKNILMTLIGALAFPDFRFRPSNAAGLGVSMAGAIYYATKSAQRALQKASQQKMLLRDSSASKQPLIGRDRLSALRASGSMNGMLPVSRSSSGKLTELAQMSHPQMSQHAPQGSEKADKPGASQGPVVRQGSV